MTVQLIIKSAAQTVEDFKIVCDLSWTIGQVKDQIALTYPTKPAKENQKLIYGGKLLPDHLPLTSVLHTKQDVHILHLVCPLPYEPETLQLKTNNEKNTPTCPVPPMPSSGIYPQVNQQLPASSLFSGTPPMINTFALNTPADVLSQYQAMQQMYTQLMAQYLSQYNGNAPIGQTPAVTPISQPATPPQPQRNAAANDGEEQQRLGFSFDWIDLVYIFSRSVVFFALLMLYSSPPRVIAVCLLLLVLTLFAKYNKLRQQQQVAEMARQEAMSQQNRVVEQPEEQAAENNEQETGNASTENSSASPTQSNSAQAATSMSTIILSVITSFFTSLVPNDPLPVNAN